MAVTVTFGLLWLGGRCTVYPKKYAHGVCFVVLCCGYTLTDFPISIRLTSLALCNLTIAPVPAKQPWWIWINTSCEFNMNDCITTTKQSTTKPCAYYLGYTVDVLDSNRGDFRHPCAVDIQYCLWNCSRWMPLNNFDNTSTLVCVMTLYWQAISEFHDWMLTQIDIAIFCNEATMQNTIIMTILRWLI